MGILYFIVALFATIVGTLSGFGGGVIIKPTLDALGHYNVFVIGVLSSATVFSMSLVSTIRRVIDGIKITGYWCCWRRVESSGDWQASTFLNYP